MFTAEIAKQIATMRGHLGDEVATHIEKAMRDVAVVSLEKNGDPNMPTMDELAAQITALTKRADAAEFELTKAKLPAEVQTYITDSAMSAEDQAAFVKASSADQAKTMKDKPAKKTPAVDPDAADDDAEMKKRDQTIADLKKSIAKFEAEAELLQMRKRASEVGLPESQADVILKASKGDPDAFAKVLELVKASNAQAKTSNLFNEFGSSRVAKEGSAAAEVAAKAEEIRKSDPKISLMVARAQVIKDNPDLYQRVRQEERTGASA